MKLQCTPQELPPAKTILLWEKIMSIESKVAKARADSARSKAKGGR